MLQSVVICLLNAKVSIAKSNSVDGKIQKIPKVNVTAVTAEPGAVGSVKQRQKVIGMIEDGGRAFLTESICPASGEYVDFFKFEDYKLVILGAVSVTETENGLYIDCSPEEEWIDPVLADGILTIRQAYSIRKTDTVLEVR